MIHLTCGMALGDVLPWRGRRWGLCGVVLIAVGLFGNPPRAEEVNRRAGEAAGGGVTQHDVIPILLQHCSPCHGAGEPEGKLDLRTRAGALRGGKSGPALVLGDADGSALLRRISAGECPPNKRLVEANVKPVPEPSLAKLRAWIGAGAPEAPAEPDAAGTENDSLVRSEDREFWSFRTPRKGTLPEVRGEALAANPIDHFILRELEAKGLSFAEEAAPEVLLRRVFFDLTGLPPTPEEAAEFLEDARPGAYERLVDRLLASPRHGERWGRFWLDVAGYADAEGRREQHLPRLYAYRYRDYVIQSMNADKPYDRFLMEQIAGDELADYESAAVITQEMHDNLAATGFLRMGPDPTWANITGFIPDRLEVVADAVDVLGSGVMGLTLKCARCHDHKFDPIPQRDYFRLVDLLKGALDEYNWMKPDLRPYGGAGNSGKLPERSLSYVRTEERTAWEEQEKKLAGEIAAQRLLVEEEERRLRAEEREKGLAALDGALRAEVEGALAAKAEERTERQKELAGMHGKKLAPDREELKKANAGFKQRCDDLAALERRKVPEPRIAALWDRGAPSPTYIYRRGDHQRPGGLVTGGVPSVLSSPERPFEIHPPWPGAKKTGRRLALARWLTHPDHPLTGRVLVNRLWKHHFGRGLVRSVGDWGKAGTRPTHPELLDWLARELVEQGWRMKPLHRLMATSRVYRQSSKAGGAAGALDPDNELFSRMPLRRLEAEAIWDAALWAAGVMDETRFGPPVAVRTRADGLVTAGKGSGGWRRSIYGQQLRKEIPTILELFDLPAMNPNCLERTESIAAPQALHLLNDSEVRDLAAGFAARVRREAGADLERRLERVWRLALARAPSPDEREWGRELLGRLGAEQAGGEEEGLAVLCHALLNAAEFIYID